MFSLTSLKRSIPVIIGVTFLWACSNPNATSPEDINFSDGHGAGVSTAGNPPSQISESSITENNSSDNETGNSNPGESGGDPSTDPESFDEASLRAWYLIYN